MGKIRIGRGSAMVELDDSLERAISSAIDRMAPGLREHLESAVQQIALDAISKWPVKTGKSKAAFEWGVRLPDPNHLEGYVINPVEQGGKPYAYMIKGKQQGGRQSWKELVEKPAKAVIERLGTDLAEEATRILNRKR